MTPQRIQRKRTKGWKAPANTLNATRPGAHGNPYKMLDESDGERALSLARFESHLDKINRYDYQILIEQVRAADYVMCWCPLDKPCHVDIWIRRAKQ